jgi:RHS repeat-associated protein
MQGASVTTTIYVGHHFEVRDHDQPTKYVFDGPTRVASVIGSLSSNARIQRLRLFSGWNLCSLALTGPFPASGAEAISAAYQWNPSTRDYSPVSLGQTLTAGTILWVKAATNTTVTVLGAYRDPTAEQVQSGGTYMPCPGLETWTPNFPPTFSAWLYDPQADQWDSQLAGDLISLSDLPAVLSPGQAFYTKSDSPVPLAVPDPTLRVRYYHQDHLGSSAVVTDSAGAVMEEVVYLPFGAPRGEFETRSNREPYEFAEKERDQESGLDYFEARYLSGPLSRFITPDPKYADPDKLSSREFGAFLFRPQEINLYMYAADNPFHYVDPSGLDNAEAGTNERAEKSVEDVKWSAERGGAVVTATEIAAHHLHYHAPYLRYPGPLLDALNTGMAAGRFAADPTTANGLDLGVSGSKWALTAALPPVGLAVQLLDLTPYGPSAMIESIREMDREIAEMKLEIEQTKSDIQRINRETERIRAATERTRAERLRMEAEIRQAQQETRKIQEQIRKSDELLRKVQERNVETQKILHRR